MRPRNIIFIVPLVLGLIACSKAPQNREAVEKAVVEYLKGRPGLDMNSMEVQITGLNFREKEADATVVIQAKGTKDAGGSMTMKYVLEQKDGKWVVKGRSGGNEHGGSAPGGAEPPAGGALPPGHPPAGGTKAGSGSEGKK
ncbi:MAG: hypothetical protein HY820_01430 [Acidobacteria bacterium]|nr:hypothetical protein [Acidobacteriota bacterium]